MFVRLMQLFLVGEATMCHVVRCLISIKKRFELRYLIITIVLQHCLCALYVGKVMSWCIDFLENSYVSMYAGFVIRLCSVLGVCAV